MSVAYWSLFIGLLLILMVLMSTLLTRLPLSNAMIYLALGFAIGTGMDVPDPMAQSALLRCITEVALLISLFAAGLKLGIPFFGRRWLLPLRLAFPTMAITIGLIALAGMWGMGLSLGAAVLLGAILAPTDPVLASGIEPDSWTKPGALSFGLTGESALNDGAAYPFVLLGLGLMGFYELGVNGVRWLVIDLVWATLAGLLIGAVLGSMLARLIVFLRTRYHAALGLDEFLSLGLIAISYGIAQLSLASGFLAVFAAGLTLHRLHEQSPPLDQRIDAIVEPTEDPTTHPRHARAALVQRMNGFNEQIEKLVELAMVLLIGAMLPHAMAGMTVHLWWFVPLLFLVLRPLAVWIGLAGTSLGWTQRAMIGWFGIRGVGSVFYLMFALEHGVRGSFAQELIALTLITVAMSIVAHGVSVLSLTEWYKRRKRLRV